MTLPPEALKALALGEQVAKQEELNDLTLMSLALQRLQESADRYYVEHVILKGVEGNEQTADYGPFYYRKWTGGEVIELKTHPAYVQSEKNFQLMAIRQLVPPVTKEDLELRLDMFCEFVARAAHPNHGMTKENLKERGNWAWLEYCFMTISERTGIGTALGSDIDKGLEKFRRNGSGQLPVPPDIRETAPPTIGSAGKEPKLDGIMGRPPA